MIDVYEYPLNLDTRLSTRVAQPDADEIAAVKKLQERLEKRNPGQALDLIAEIESEATAADPLELGLELTRRSYGFYLSTKGVLEEAEGARKASLLGALAQPVQPLDVEANKLRDQKSRFKDDLDQHTGLAREASGSPTWKTVLTWIEAAEKETEEEIIPAKVRADIVEKKKKAEAAAAATKAKGSSTTLAATPTR